MEHGIKCALLLTALVLLANGCSGQHTGPSTPSEGSGQGQHVEAGASADGLAVKLSFSEKALKTLVESKETVVVFGDITGSPKPGALKRYVKYGEIALGQVNAEVPPGTNVYFNRIPLQQDALEQIDSQGPHLNLNVSSGRKSSRNNLLDCRFYDGPLKAVQGGSIPISCKLIAEFLPAFRAWKKTDPLNNADAPFGPSFMSEYRSAKAEEAAKLNAQAFRSTGS